MSLDANISKSVIDEIARQLGIEADELYKAGFSFFPLVMPVHLTNLQRNLAPYGGTIEENYNTVILVNNTYGQEDLTVPAGKRWYLFGGFLLNGDDVARDCWVNVIGTEGSTLLRLLKDQAVGAATDVYFPNTEATVDQMGSGIYPIPLLAGSIIRFRWDAGGASTGGTAKYCAIVVEVDE